MSKKLTTESGRPIYEREDSQSVGKRGPLLLQDFILHEEMAHFNRERIPERSVHAHGSGAFGTFRVTHDITKYTRAKIFSEVGKETKMFARFSTVAGEKGSADTVRDPRGFALKFYTDDGIWDMVGNNTPIFFVKDPKKFQDFIHTQKRDPYTHQKSRTMRWDFWSLNPESLHQVLILFSDRGTPFSYRHMNGYSSHTYSFINKDDERVWMKIHLKTEQGIKNFTEEEAMNKRGENPDFHQQDLLESIEKGDFPRWKMKVQIMTDEQAKNFEFNPFDLSKVWPHKDYPLIDVGVMELNQNPENYFQDVEQAAFAPSNIVDGIDFSPDKMLQGRILSYNDAHRYRLGINHYQIPVNRPTCPYHHYHRDGQMRVDGNFGSQPNYYPNRFDGIKPDPAYKQVPMKSEADWLDWYDRNAPGEDDHYTQPGKLFREVMDDKARKHLIENLVASMDQIEGDKRDDIIKRQLQHFEKADKQLAQGVAEGLNVSSW